MQTHYVRRPEVTAGQDAAGLLTSVSQSCAVLCFAYIIPWHLQSPHEIGTVIICLCFVGKWSHWKVRQIIPDHTTEKRGARIQTILNYNQWTIAWMSCLHPLLSFWLCWVYFSFFIGRSSLFIININSFSILFAANICPSLSLAFKLFICCPLTFISCLPW